MIWLVGIILLSGCGKDKQADNNQNNDNNVVGEHVYGIDDIYGKTSLTAEDLDIISDKLFPASYSYAIYGGEWSEDVDTGEYTYPSTMSHDLLLPENVNIVSKELISSVVDGSRINTVIKAKTYDGAEYSILYLNDAESLRYLAASVDDGQKSILYTFHY